MISMGSNIDTPYWALLRGLLKELHLKKKKKKRPMALLFFSMTKLPNSILMFCLRETTLNANILHAFYTLSHFTRLRQFYCSAKSFWTVSSIMIGTRRKCSTWMMFCLDFPQWVFTVMLLISRSELNPEAGTNLWRGYADDVWSPVTLGLCCSLLSLEEVTCRKICEHWEGFAVTQQKDCPESWERGTKHGSKE